MLDLRRPRRELSALAYLHSAGVAHRDIKPGNILVNSDGLIKLCDFGMSRSLLDDTRDLSTYVVTRWYRAPELLCNCKDYGYGVDVWAAGCVLAELILKRPLWAGRGQHDQLNLILDTLGELRREDYDFVNAEYRDHIEQFIANRRSRPSTNAIWQIITRCRASPEAADMLRGLLEFNPVCRWTAREALKHPYIICFEKHTSSKLCDEPFPWKHETCLRSMRDFQDEIYRTVMGEAPVSNEVLTQKIAVNSQGQGDRTREPEEMTDKTDIGEY